MQEQTPSLQDLEILKELEARTNVRSSFLAWCQKCGYEPAKHHRLLIKELEALVTSLLHALETGTASAEGCMRLMVLMPPGAAKSTYISKLFPPWFLAQLKGLGILACSHEAGLATDFGRVARNLIDSNERWLGYELRKDSRAADKWETTNGGNYQAAGVGSGISGRRAHLGIIDDFCGSEEEAQSKLFNDKVWTWYENDFVNRLQPNAARVIIANHRNEDDLVGRLMQNEPAKWRVIRLRLLIETEEQAETDPLNRNIGEYLWPEYFTRPQVEERMSNPRASGIQQQEPTPEKGGFFQAEWIKTYDSLPSPEESNVYAASDHAVSERQTADPSCFGLGVFHDGNLYIHQDLVWRRLGPKDAIEQMLRLIKKYSPLNWWAEKGHISKSLGPFLRDRMMEEQVYGCIEEVTPSKDKMTRAQSIRGMMQMGLVYLPAKAEWLKRAKHELLTFPNGKHDDFVDFLSHLGRGIASMNGQTVRKNNMTEDINKPFMPTLRWLKDSVRAKNRLRIAALND